jgi:hypothetical protein
MNDDWNDRLDEYIEGVLPAEEVLQVEEALARDPVLRAEFDRVRRFAELMEEQTPDAHAVKRVMSRLRARQRRWLFLAAPLAAAAAALLIWLAWPPGPPPTHVNQVLTDLEARWLSFGERLGEIALERREGRVPRSGVGGLEVPPPVAYGIVFKGALAKLSVKLDPGVERRVLDLVRHHHEMMRPGGQGLEGRCERAEASLALYREIARAGGPAVADAYYDVFRPGRTDFAATERVRPDDLQFVVADHERYREAYRQAVSDLERRFGGPSVAAVVARLAPIDARVLWYDEGVGREADLAIRAQLYEAARDAGADKLYVEG